MKIIRTSSYKKAQDMGQQNPEVVDVYARYIGDGYLAYAEYASNPAASGERFWPDYYDGDHNIDESDTVLLKNVPIELAKQLVEQGGSNQYFSDGYEAANAAAPYVVEGGRNINDYPPDTPMGMEDDNPIE